MKIKLLMLGIAGASLLVSCKKKNQIQEEYLTQNNQTHANYMPLKDGNYWVYQQKNVDTLGNTTGTNLTLDTITVLGDTIINNKTYKYLKSSRSFSNGSNYNFLIGIPQFIRKENGEIFSPGNLTENCIFSLSRDTLVNQGCFIANWAPNCRYKLSKFMANTTTSVNIPFGTFSTYNAKELTISNIQNEWPFWKNKRYRDFQCAKNIGLIRSTTFFVSGTSTMVYELVDYHLN
jgi:hypothetical protein